MGPSPYKLISAPLQFVKFKTELTSSSNLLIGTRIYNGSVQLPLNGKIYYVKVKDKSTGALVRDYIPVYNVTTKEIGLYDLVNDDFYTNQGSGEFDKGEDFNEDFSAIVRADLKNSFDEQDNN